MPNTVPNQRLVAIHRERASSDFLGIKNSHWQAAARDLGAHALMLYLYFASNANGFMLALSPAAIRQAVGMPSSTYRDQFVRLVDKGYQFFGWICGFGTKAVIQSPASVVEQYKEYLQKILSKY